MNRKRKAVIFVTVAIMLLGASPAYAGDCGSDNITVVVMNASRFSGFCIGVIDTVFSEYVIPPKTTVKQVETIVFRYLEAHPEEWHLCGATLVIKAIAEKYPKRK